jgi:hypothetical protein
MQKTILLVSRDEALQNTRAFLLEASGYRTMKTGSSTAVAQLGVHCHMLIIGHSFTPEEQDDLIDCIHESNPGVFIVCLRCGFTEPNTLLKAVSRCFAAQPGGPRVYIVEGDDIISDSTDARQSTSTHCSLENELD